MSKAASDLIFEKEIGTHTSKSLCKIGLDKRNLVGYNFSKILQRTSRALSDSTSK